MKHFVEGKSIAINDNKLVKGRHQKQGFTLIELVVVIAIISLLLTISVPVLIKVRRHGRAILDINNKKQITRAANLYTLDNKDRYPNSVCTIGGFPGDWGWQEPMMLVARQGRMPDMHRSISAYLHPYIKDSGIMYCPNAPLKSENLQEIWDAGDNWVSDSGLPGDLRRFSGTYCFYWDYTGHLEAKNYLFKGPRCSAGDRGHSKVMVTCYFGYDNQRSRGCFGSCQRIKGAFVTEGTHLSSAYWSRAGNVDSDIPKVKLNAGYTDEHVEGYLSSETAAMRVIWKSKYNEPYPVGTGPGVFYLPRNGIH